MPIKHWNDVACRFPLLREDTFERITLMAKLVVEEVEEIDYELSERNAG